MLLALWTGFTFVGFFTPIRELGGRWCSTLSTGPWETFWILFYGAATCGNAGFLREQVCIYMCPYARFQSAMFDRDTLIISYDPARGEPRGSRPRRADPRAAGLGDCIDCRACVQVCPTGIDIRDGLQYECIACAACVDACDTVMDRMGYPRGLIRYTTQQALEGQAHPRDPAAHAGLRRPARPAGRRIPGLARAAHAGRTRPDAGPQRALPRRCRTAASRTCIWSASSTRTRARTGTG